MNPRYYFQDPLDKQRAYLVASLKSKGITDERILRAINEIPREKFISGDIIDRAYDDNALPITHGQTISQLYTVAYMTDLLRINEGDKILEIGTGSGYQASILSHIGARVFTVERIQELLDNTRLLFHELGLNINTRYGDGSLGWKEFAPYDGIIVTAAAPKIPESLKSQLKVGGRLVIPVGGRVNQTMYVLEKTGENSYREYDTDSFKFVPLIGKEAWEEE